MNAFSRDETVIKKIKAHLHPNEIQSEVQKVNEVHYGCLLCNSIYHCLVYLFILGLCFVIDCIVRNNTTLSSDPKKMSGSDECLRGIHIPQSAKVKNVASSAECLNSGPTPMVCQIYSLK